jgi:hypothetical protein
LAENDDLKLLAMRWASDAVELALDDNGKLRVWSFRAGAPPKRRTIGSDVLCGGDCYGIEAAYHSARDGEWHALAHVFEPRLAFADVSETGKRTALPGGNITRFQIDALAWGVIDRPAEYVLDRGGKLLPAPSGPPWVRGKRIYSHRFVRAKDDTFEWLFGYELDHEGGASFDRVHDQLLDARFEQSKERSGTPGAPGWEDERLMIEGRKLGLLGPEPAHTTHAIARIHECGALPIDGAIFSSGGDYLIFEPSGCYVTLDSELRRKDPWDLADHLRMRGSMYLDWNEPWHLFELLFVLFAPLLIGIAVPISKRRPISAVVFALALAAASVWLLNGLWPLLR